MSESQPSKKRPDYIAHAVVPGTQSAPTRFIRIGVGFQLKNGRYSVLTDGAALSGHVILVGIDAELPSLSGFKHGTPVSAPHLVASMVRDAGTNNSYWTDIGSAYRHDGYISVHVAVWPASNKIILTVPRERE